MIRLADIIPENLKKASDEELYRVWAMLSQMIEAPNINKEEIINHGIFLLNELNNRKLDIQKDNLYSEIEKFKKTAGVDYVPKNKARDKSEKQDQESYDFFQEAIRPPFGSPGGKRYMADRLIRMFPDHRVYVEPFIGGGAVFYKKKKSADIKEVINDKDKDIYHCFKTIQNLSERDYLELKKMSWTASKSGFAETLNSIKSSTGIKRFHDVVYLKQFSDVSECKTYDDRDDGKTWAGINNLMRLKERLKGVIILNEDYDSVIKKYDSKETFFYIDPPYPSAKLNWKFMPTEAEVESAVANIKGKFLMSYEVTKAFNKFTKKTIKLWAIAHPGDRDRFKTEQLIMNYSEASNTRYLETTGLGPIEWVDIFHDYFVENGFAKNWLNISAVEKHQKICEAFSKIEFKPDENWADAIVGEARYRSYKHIASSLDLLLREQDIYLKNPSEDKKYDCVFQHHYRPGKTSKEKNTSVHTDLRMEIVDKQSLIGFTIMDQVEGAVNENITTLQQAKTWDKKDVFKINWNTGEWKKRIKKGSKEPVNAELVTVKKSLMPHEWLFVEGVVEPGMPGATEEGPGVYSIVDKGTMEYGVQNSKTHEYFFNCSKIDYRLVMRSLSMQQAESIVNNDFMKVVFLNNLFEEDLDIIIKEAKENSERIVESLDLTLEAEIIPAKRGGLGKSGSGWVVIKPIEQLPYVLSDGAVSKKFIPPKDISALPKEIKEQIPEEFKYWLKENESERLSIRDELVDAIKKQDINIKLNESWLAEIDNIFAYDPTAIRTKVLLDDWRLCCAWYAGKKADRPLKYSTEQIIDIAGKILHELKHRKIEFSLNSMSENSKELYDKLSESQHKRDQCMECSKPPTIEVKWAEGMGHAWFCDEHWKLWSKEHKDDIDYVKKVKNGTASEKFSDNTNPNIKNELF